MAMMLVVVLVVSGALLVGAAWGIYGRLSEKTEQFLVALAGGALLLSVVSELIDPAIEKSSVWVAAAGVLVGAITFALLDRWLDREMDEEDGGGLLLSIVMDGIPENLALGVALIGAGVNEVAALAGSILLSNLPEAAGGAKEMRNAGRSSRNVFLLWAGTAIALSLAAIAGNIFLAGVGEHWLSAISCFAAGAVVASLAMEVFPRAYREHWHMVGVATALGVIMAFLFGSLGGA